MLFKISTGFFVWDVFKWLLLFMIAASALFFAVKQVLKKDGGVRLSNESTLSNDEPAGVFSCQPAGSFLEKCVEPWAKLPYSPLLGIGALFLLFAAAVFMG